MNTPGQENHNSSDIRRGLNLILIGPPGCGKGTQAVHLSRRYNLLHFSTGAALREQIRRGTELGKQVEPYLKRGELISDQMMIDVIYDALAALPEGQGILLDGFPRTIPQATALEKILKLDGVVEMELEDDAIVERITGRRMGEDGQSYHIRFAPPPPGVKTTHREDDTEPVVRERLRIYHTQTVPLLDFYRERNLLHTVAGGGPIEEVEALLNDVVAQIVVSD